MKTRVKKMKRIITTILVSMVLLSMTACGKTENSEVSGIDILPKKIENVSDGMKIAEGCEPDEHDDTVYPLEYLGGVWVIEGLYNNYADASATKNTMVLETSEGKVEVESMPVQLNLMPFKENPFEEIGVAYGELLYKKIIKDAEISFEDRYYKVPVIFDTHKNIIALGMFADLIKYEDGKLADIEGNSIDTIELNEFECEIEWTGWNLTLKKDGMSVSYVPNDIDNGQGVSFVPEVCESAGLCFLSGEGVKSQFAIPLHEDYEALDNIIKVDPVGDATDLGNIQLYLEKEVSAEYSFSEDGKVTIKTEDSGTYPYNFLYSGRSLVLKDDKRESLYSVYANNSQVHNNAITIDTESENSISFSSDLIIGNQSINMSCDTIDFWLSNGATTNANLEQLLAPRAIEEIEFEIDGQRFTAKLANVYDTHITYAEADIAGIYIDGTKCNGMICNSYNRESLEYGVSTIQEVFDYWEEVPCDKSESHLTYKSGVSRIETNVSVFSMFGPEAKKVIIEDDGEREITYMFEDGVLVGIERVAPALLYAGLQDNIVGDDLLELEPSYVGGVTVVRDTILDRLKAEFAAKGISVNINENTGEVVMPNGILFGVDQYELSSEGKDYIDSFMSVYASVLLSDEFVNVISGIGFEGHCDPAGTDAYNQVLSQNRADSVKNWCAESTSNGLSEVQKSKLSEMATAKGYSFSDPVFDENGNVDNDASRRVAIKFYINIDAAGNVVE